MTYLEVTFDDVSMAGEERAFQGEKKESTERPGGRYCGGVSEVKTWDHRPGNCSNSFLSLSASLPRSHHLP